MATPKTPHGLRARGRRFWRATVDDFELSHSELEVLVEICRLLDQCDALRRSIEQDGYVVTGSRGQPRAHPAICEANASRALAGRLLAQLDLPDEQGEDLSSPERARAQRAAHERWRDQKVASAARRGQGGKTS